MKKITLALVVATVMVAGAAGSAQAFPSPGLRALPNASDSLFVFPCGDDFPTTAGLVDVANGVIAGVGSPAVPDACFYNGDFDASTNTAYVVDYTDNHVTLASFNVTNGTLTPIGAFFVGSPTNYIRPLALAISASGAAFASGGADNLYAVNLATAEMTRVGSALTLGMNSFDFNPVDGLLYGISYNAGGVYTINPENGEETLVGDYPAGASAGLQFDSAGVAWFQNQQEGIRLFSATDMTHLESSQALQGTFTYDGEQPYVESLLYVPAPVVDAPVLAATGIFGSGGFGGGSEGLAGLAFGATALVIGGGALLMVRRRRNASS
jgi:hypothetical protein